MDDLSDIQVLGEQMSSAHIVGVVIRHFALFDGHVTLAASALYLDHALKQYA